MTKGKLVKVLVLWSAVIVGLLISAGGILIVRRGFSARDHPSVLETYIAKTARKLSVPASQRNATNPFAPTPEVLRERELTSPIIAPFATAMTESERPKSDKIFIRKRLICGCPQRKPSRTERSTTSSTTAFALPECLPGGGGKR